MTYVPVARERDDVRGGRSGAGDVQASPPSTRVTLGLIVVFGLASAAVFVRTTAEAYCGVCKLPALNIAQC